MHTKSLQESLWQTLSYLVPEKGNEKHINWIIDFLGEITPRPKQYLVTRKTQLSI